MRAVVWLPALETDRWLRVCMRYLDEHEHVLAAVVVDDGSGRPYSDAVAMLTAGDAGVIVAAKLEHVPLWRTEIAASAPPDAPPVQRRPTLVPRLDASRSRRIW